MKKHTTVTITRRMLTGYGACGSGIRDVASFLPAKLSTDPEKNIEIACALADAEFRRAHDRAWWLMCKVSPERNACPDEYRGGLLASPNNNSSHTQHDAWIIAQYLAWVADALATRAGR